MSSQEPQLLDHSYDGIQEYDNPLPGWWKALFWICFFFAVGYWIYYHVMGTGQMKLDEYAAEMAEADAKWPKFVLPPKTEDELKTMVADPALVAKGAAKFKEVCAVCHGEKAEGKIGPNLTDKAWIHGGKLANIYASVGNGWPTKGMQAWGPTLKPDDLQAVVAFVASLRNTNVPGKEPQGTTEDDAAAPAPVAAPPAAAPAAPAAEAATPAAAPVPVAPTEAAVPAAVPAAPF
jgi:cytochrome c oxidase cbb3-type subunit 3